MSTASNPNPQPDDVGKKSTKNKRPRPFTIEYRYDKERAEKRSPWISQLFKKNTEWKVHNRYRTADERDNALHHLTLNHASWIFEYRKGEP